MVLAVNLFGISTKQSFEESEYFNIKNMPAVIFFIFARS